jgi:hypothetical protein
MARKIYKKFSKPMPKKSKIQVLLKKRISLKKLYNWNSLIALGIIISLLWLYSSSLQSITFHNQVITGPAGSVQWKLLAGTRNTYFTKDGQIVPEYYPEEVKKLANKSIRIQGYMVALQAKEESSKFLLVAKSPTCPYCLTSGAQETIKVSTTKPVPNTFAPVLVKGTFIIHDNDFDTSGLFYEMKDAEIVNE